MTLNLDFFSLYVHDTFKQECKLAKTYCAFKKMKQKYTTNIFISDNITSTRGFADYIYWFNKSHPYHNV